ncbi:hypothetical protein CCACVL1_26949 [Corchorus capsularis]|uniref:Plastid lipid-associated protein/fibrillin conserved domain-containing protein n=1 Tax=Corchorus capsularis TaxID=210143 RepID=A0A1R3GCX9_COCAP|nr:hypothetical protein CCACVL1_26949 [Corchorus capsularis]
MVLNYFPSPRHESGLSKIEGKATLLAPMSAFISISNKLIKPAIFSLQVVPRKMSKVKERMKICRVVSATNPISKSNTRFRSTHTTKVAEHSTGLVGDEENFETIPHLKTKLYQELQGINRGIFGVPSSKKSDIEALVKLLESQNPTPDPTLNLDKVSGCWKLVYSTITILGSKRTKLGLRDFITLGEFFQTIDVEKRVDINYDNSTITPDQG